MKTVKNLVVVALLVLSLAFTTLAGEIDVPGVVNPPPPRMTVSEEIPEETSTIPEQEAETSDYLFFEALAALLSMY